MGRIIGIDYGSKRTGLAVTDREKIIATPLVTTATDQLFSFLSSYMDKECVESFVVGWPLSMAGRVTSTTRRVRVFMRSLRQQFPQQAIYFYDERLTSLMAVKAQIASGAPKKERRSKKNLDAISASFILYSFLAHPSPALFKE